MLLRIGLVVAWSIVRDAIAKSSLPLVVPLLVWAVVCVLVIVSIVVVGRWRVCAKRIYRIPHRVSYVGRSDSQGCLLLFPMMGVCRWVVFLLLILLLPIAHSLRSRGG